MHPIALVIGSLTIRWYGIMFALAIGIGIAAIYFESQCQGINADNILDIEIAAVIGGIAGARLGWIATSSEAMWYLAHPLSILAIWGGGLSYFGGIIGGLIAA